MKLHSNWKLILRKAWSIRLVVLSAVFSAAQLVIPVYGDVLPRDAFAILSAVACAGAIIARVVTQKEFPDE